MRLDVLEHGHRRPARTFLRVASATFRAEVDDVVKTALHRPELFGRAMLDLVADVMRGRSFWTSGEREYMAAFTSRLNECPFCQRVHSETMRLESQGALDLDGDGPLRPELASVLPLLERVTRAPQEVTPADVDAVRAAGVPDDAIIDALHVNMVFNTVNRLANAFDWSWDSEAHTRTGARVIHLTRYKLPGFVWR